MPYVIRKSIDIDFSHHIRGHAGACINLHGHTWKFEVGLQADVLDKEGFVIDFGLLKRRVLKPCHALLDHALAVGSTTWDEVGEDLARVGAGLVASRGQVHGESAFPQGGSAGQEGVALNGANNRFPGGMKVAVFAFSPTSERLARWLYELAVEQLADERVTVSYARIYETLHPVEAVAEFRAD